MPIKKIESRFMRFYNHQFKFSILLIFIILYLFAVPIFPRSGLWDELLNLLSTFMLLSAIGAVSNKPRTFKMALILGVIAVIGIWYAKLMGEDFRISTGVALALLSQTLFLWMVVILVLKHILEYKEISIDVLAGAIAAYLFLGIAFAYTYSITMLYDPGALISGGSPLDPGTAYIDLAYFSFVTLTTLGYGDITPGTPLVKTIVYFEAAFGVLYMATIIASFVGIHISQKQSE